MILENTKATSVEMGGGLEGSQPREYKIAQSKAAYRTLSSRLYSDKPRAIVRELSCNAYDAHVMAGKADVPFEIHLPTSFEPYFRISDFGVGLNPNAPYVFIVETDEDGISEEVRLGAYVEGMELPEGAYVRNINEVIDLFTTYFGTNKDRNNQVIGALGLGSKSPFCYTEVYTVTNRFNGRTQVYECFFNKKGNPALRDIADNETPGVVNGLDIQFAVKQNDIWEFHNKAKIALEFFNPKPILNIENFEIPQQTYTLKTGNWAMRQVDRTPQGYGLRAIQGNVPYSVGDIDISRLSETQRKITEMPLDFTFPLGSLDPKVDRESLELNEKNVEALIRAINEVEEGLLEEVKKKINGCQHGWEARLLIHDLTMQEGLGGIVNDAFNREMLFGKYDNFTLSGKNPVINELDFNYIKLTSLTKNTRKTALNPKKEKLFVATKSTLRDIMEGTKSREHYEISIELGRNVAFVINDLPKKGDKYVSYFVQESGESTYKTVYLINKAHAWVSMQNMTDDTLVMLKKLGNPPLLKASDLKAKYGHIVDAPKEKAKVTRERRKIVALKDHVPYGRSSYRSNLTGWRKAWRKAEDAELGLEGIKFYVLVDRKSGHAYDTGYNRARDFREFVDMVGESNLIPEVTDQTIIFGLKADSELRNQPDWVEFNSYVWNFIKGFMTPTKQLELSLLLEPFSMPFERHLTKAVEEGLLPETSPVAKFLKSLAAARLTCRDFNSKARQLLNAAKSKGVYSADQTIDFEAAWEPVLDMYPAMKMMRDCINDDEEKVILAEYINMIDSRNESPRLVVEDIQLVKEGETVNVN